MAAGHCINRENSNILYIIKRALPPEDSQRKKYEKENVEDGVVRIDSVQHVVHYAGVGMGGR